MAGTINTLRYLIAVMLVVAIPAAIGYWLLIHPFVRFWRRLGLRGAYGVISPLLAAIMTVMFLLRQRLLAVDWGSSLPLAVTGVACLAASGLLLRSLRKQLSVKALIGVPELDPDHSPGRLLSTGIYGRIRHPRYVQMTLALLGYALIANYPAAYAAWLFWLAGIYAVALLEERELAERFGAAYRQYCRRVPRFLPRLRGRGR